MAKTRLSGIPQAPEVPAFELKIGARLSDVRLTEPIESGSKLALWRGRHDSGVACTVHALVAGATKRECDTFMKSAGRILAARAAQGFAGVSPIVEVVPAAVACIADFTASGTLADLPVLDWEFARKVAFLERLGLGLATLHERGIFHGCLRPQSIVLDEEFNPVVSDVGAIVLEDSFPGTADARNEYWAYAAREVRQGQAPNARSDVFSLGRLMQFVLTVVEPDEEDENLPKLDSLASEQVGMVRIIRRATLRDPAQRYETITQLLEELSRYQDINAVGIAHPEGLDGKERRRDSRLPGSAPEPRDSKSALAFDGKKPEASTVDSSKKAVGEKPRTSRLPAAPVSEARGAVDPVTSTLAIVLGGLGFALLGLSLFLAYRAGQVTGAARSVEILGALLASTTLPGLSQWYVFRPVWAAACVALIVASAPTGLAASSGRQAKFSHGTPAQRGAFIVQFLREGRTEFRELDLAKADFTGQSLRGADFTGSKLTRAVFRGADLSKVNFSDADVTRADFGGADLENAEVSGSLGWRETICDEKTKMPVAWVCERAKPASKHDVPGIH